MMKPKREPLVGINKKDLEFLVEEFLEKDEAFFLEKFKNQGNKVKTMVLRLDRILFKDEFWMDQCDEEDHQSTDFAKVLHGWHKELRPLWEKIKKALLDYKNKVLPMREASLKKGHKSLPRKYQGLLGYDPYQMDKYYDFKLRAGPISHVTMCFDAGRIDIYNRDYKIKVNLLDLLKGIPISVFGKCNYCGKLIVITRKDKKYCPGCAAKRWQKEKWDQDPVALREKERKRYKDKRKKKIS